MTRTIWNRVKGVVWLGEGRLMDSWKKRRTGTTGRRRRGFGSEVRTRNRMRMSRRLRLAMGKAVAVAVARGIGRLLSRG